MKFLISYFYQIRFFQPNQFPVSTALWDPKWYHEFRKPTHVFTDKRGVVNGLRSPILNPPTGECAECDEKEDDCIFKRHYKEYLDSIDFDQFIADIEESINAVSDFMGVHDPEIVLIVHEAPDNPCSERWPLIEWFKEHGIELKEFTK